MQGFAGRAVGMFQDRLDRRIALQDFQARHPEMSAWESNVAFYAQEKQQLPWQHETSMARAGEMGHATEMPAVKIRPRLFGTREFSLSLMLL